MLRFRVTKNGVFIGMPFNSHEEAVQFAELEKQEEPSAIIQVQLVLTVGEELDPSDGEELVEAILEGEDFSELPPEHRGPLNPSDDEPDEEAPEAASGHTDAGSGKQPTKHGKQSKATPTESFFVRHPSRMAVADEVLEELWAQDTLAVRLSDVGGESEDSKPATPLKFGHKMDAKHFAELAEKGGYVWCESRVRPGVAKVGRVVSQQPRDVRATWTPPQNPHHAGEAASEIVLRTLRLEDAQEVTAAEATSLRSVRPLMGTLQRWTDVGRRLEALVEGVPLERNWINLTPLQQRAVCTEFLRSNENPKYPKLKFLLTPDGAKLEQVDVFGMEDDGTEILARVTSLQKNSKRAKSEAWALKKKYHRPGRRLLLFCSVAGSDDPASFAPSLFPPETFQVIPEDDVLFVFVEQVLEWVKGHDVYATKLFSL